MNRILIIGYIPKINGISTSVLNVYRNLDRSRFQYDFLLCSDYMNWATPDLQEILSLGANLYYMDYSKYEFPESSYSDLEKLMLSIPDLKGVHVHDLYLMSQPLHIADKLGFPVKAIQCHVSWGDVFPNSPANSSDFAKRRDLIKGNQFDRLACSDLAGQFNFGDLPFKVIPNGVDTNRFSFNPIHRHVLRSKLGIDEKTCVIAAVANLFDVKNPIFALEAFRHYHSINSNSRYFILGSGSMKAALYKYVADHNLSDCVHFFGSQHEIDIFYDAIDIILHPSISEGLPNSLIEAQAKGIPCLVSDTVSEMVKLTPLITSFSLSEDAEAWAEELSRINDNRPDRRSWKAEIKASGYDAQDVAKKIMTLYSNRIQGQEI